MIVETFDETSAEIHSTLDQMAEAFELLMAKPDQAQRGARTEPAGDEEGLEWEDVAAADGTEGNSYYTLQSWLHTVFLTTLVDANMTLAL